MTATAAEIAATYDRTADTQRALAKTAIEDLMSTLVDVRASLEHEASPFTLTNGDLGVVGEAVEIQRHVDAWLAARSTASVLTRNLTA